MCGLVGFFFPRPLIERDQALLRGMRDLLRHRGPDDAGEWRDPEAGLGLGHRRLSIIDLSAAGAQPMLSSTERYAIAYNGEVYNFPALRERLEREGAAPRWRGGSDTEVLLAMIEAWGVERACTEARGMFAFALWDRQERRLTLARDPMGEKPLYLAKLGDGVGFASELKALAAHPDFDRTEDRDAIALSLQHGYIPAPKTIYRDAVKIEPGAIVRLSRDDLASPPAALPRTLYFDLFDEAVSARRNRFDGDAAEAAERLDALLRQSIGRQMLADVPVGSFLSGGVDSSTITAIMQDLSPRPVRTFTIGFKNSKRDETPYAQEMAAHLGTEHHEQMLEPDDARSLIAKMPDLYDEPFADQSQLPTALLCQYARQSVTVCLSGDAADELFAGYRRYHGFQKSWDRSAAARKLDLMRNRVGQGVSGLLGGGDAARTLSRLSKLARLQEGDAAAAYAAGFCFTASPERLLNRASPTVDPLVRRVVDASASEGWSVLDQITLIDCFRYLPDDILTKVDRAAMASSLETRVPMLDVDIVRFSLSLPDSLRVDGSGGKAVLRRVLAKYAPRNLWERPKQGFGIPAGDWLRGPLHPLVSDLLASDIVADGDLFDKKAVDQVWAAFQKKRYRADAFWTLFSVAHHLQAMRGAPRLAA